jgi:hypothetical protein
MNGKKPIETEFYSSIVGKEGEVLALEKFYMTKYGVQAQYYMVSGVNTNKISQSATITLYGYPSREARQNGCTPLDIRLINVNPDKFDKYFSIQALEGDNQCNQYRQAYLYVKENDEFFKDSADLLYDESNIDPNGFIGENI